MKSTHIYVIALSSLLTLLTLQACIDEVSISLSSSDLYVFNTDSTFKPLDQRLDAIVPLESCDPSQVAWVQPKLNQGVCQNSRKFCINGYFQEPDYDQIQHYEQEEKTCDSLDNDCDGFVDEKIVIEIECGTGVCQNIGKKICKDGQIMTECEEKQMLNVLDDDCNGKDDNCNGQIDDGFEPTSVDCGAGFCSAMGLKVCINGQVQSTCTPDDGLKKENDINCDGVDEDCDRIVDEDYMSVPILCNQGVCERRGERICINGQTLNDCERISPSIEEVDASCNGQDDDCDGQIDEGYMSSAITCGQGLCQVQGSRICRDGQPYDQCQPFISSFNSDLICNGQDEDCDGMVDEDFQGMVTSCGTGACETTGVMSCQNGRTVDTCSAPSGTAEICNGRDDDCDGLVDDGITRNTSCGQGVCSRMAVEICMNGSWISQCQQGPSGIEACNGQDDDCDGVVDNVPQKDTLCIPGRDVTASSVCNYTYQCDDQTATLTCKPLANNQQELCNGQDDNCNGSIDEGGITGFGSCVITRISDTGISSTTDCSSQAWTCSNGIKVCNAMACNMGGH